MVKRHRKWQNGGNTEEVAESSKGTGSGRMLEILRKWQNGQKEQEVAECWKC